MKLYIIKLGRSIVYIEGSQVIISKTILYFFRTLKINFVQANCVDPDEMTPFFVAFHLGLHCKSTHIGVFSVQMVNVSSCLRKSSPPTGSIFFQECKEFFQPL